MFFEYLKDLPLVNNNEYDNLNNGNGKVVVINKEKCAVSKDQMNSCMLFQQFVPT